MAVIQNIEKIIFNVTGEKPLCCVKWYNKMHLLWVRPLLLVITLKSLKRYYNRLILHEIIVVDGLDIAKLFPMPLPPQTHAYGNLDPLVLIYHISSVESGLRFFIYIEINGDESVDSATEVWPGAWIQEEEAKRLFGISFRNSRRSPSPFLHGQFKGYPLRKSYRLEDYQEYQAIVLPKVDISHRELKKKKTTLLSPINANLKLEGEILKGKILSPLLEWGYLHKGFEKIAEHTKYRHLTRLIERIGFRSPVNSAMIYVEMIEKALDIAIPIRACAIRIVFRETGRILSHLQMNLSALSDLNLMIYANQYRNYVAELGQFQEKITGSRLAFDLVQLGGVSQDLEINDCNNLKLMLGQMQKELITCQKRLENDHLFLQNTKDMAAVSQEDCINYGVTGIVARSVGLAIDSRKENESYIELGVDLDIPTRDSGDVFARFCLVTAEIIESIRITLKLLGKLPYGEIRNHQYDIEYLLGSDRGSNIAHMFAHTDKVLSGVTLPKSQYFGFGEGFAGEQSIFLRGQDSPFPYRLKFRSPSMANAACFEHLASGMDSEVVDLAYKNFFIEPWEMDR